jgi:GntR family transcriptional repressor for pyruvate dehydrogenase complex
MPVAHRAAPAPQPLEDVIARPVSRLHAYEQVLARIEPLIREGRLRRGARLPSERDLAQALGVSRNSLREAIRVLIARGALEPRPGSGTFITEPSTDRMAISFASVLSDRSPELLDIMEFRRALEPAVAASAAQRAGPRDVAEMHAILDRHAERVRSGVPAVEEDAQFHTALAAATRNPVFARVVDQCLDLVQATRQRVLQSRTRAKRSLEGHLRILDAVKRHDPEAARNAMLAHLIEVEGLIRKVR